MSENKRVKIVGHRGASAKCPENTMAAFREAWAQGADAVECDVHMTADKQIVCIHDSDTERVTEGIRHEVATTDYAALRELDVGSWKCKEHTGERIPLLSEMLESVPEGKEAVVEVKSGMNCLPALIDVLRAAVVFPSRLILIGFDGALAKEAKRLLPEARVLWLYRLRFEEAFGSEQEEAAFLRREVKRLAVDGIGFGRSNRLSATICRPVLREGYTLNIWTVDDAKEARRYQELGVEYITTNEPGRMRAAFA